MLSKSGCAVSGSIFALNKGANLSYTRWLFNPVIEIPQPEEMCEAMSDVKGVELLITQIQET